MTMTATATRDLHGSVTTREQKRVYPWCPLEPGRRIRAAVRWDDWCGNGHNTFSVTADIQSAEGGGWRYDGSCCCHDEIARAYPELAPVIKWHLCGSDGPMYYIANTVYHARQNGPTHAWVYYAGPSDPLNLAWSKERLLGYFKADEVRRAEGRGDYRIQWDDKTAKTRDLDAARRSAVWPDATDEELTAPGLEARLSARFPALMAEFRRDVEALRFAW